MSMEVGRIDLGLDVNKKDFNRQLYGIAGGAEKDVKKAFSGLGAKIGITLGGAAVVSFVKSSLDLGSALSEVQNVVDTVFPSMNNQVNNFAQNAMEQFGLSETVAKKYIGTLGAMSKSMGFSEQASLSMSQAVAGLSGDVASFFNMTSDEAYTKLKSIWTGETESLKELGVVMTQTNLENYAMNNGFGKTMKNMDEQTRVMLRFQYVTSALGAAQGDFAKTSESWANQTRVLSLRFDSLKATLGQGFINLLTPLVQALNSLIGKLQGAANAFKTFTELVTGKTIETSTGAIANNALDATENILGMGDAAESSAKKAAKGLAGFDELNLLSSQGSGSGSNSAASGSGSTDTTTGGSTTVSDADSSLLKAFEGFKEKIQPTIDSLENLKEALKPIGEFVFSNVKSFYKDFLVPVGTWVLGEGLHGLIDALTDLLSDIDWPKLSGAIERFNKAVAPLAIAIGRGFVNFVKDLASALKPVLATTVDLLADALDGLSGILENIDPKTMEDVGYGIGVIGTALAGIKISTGLPAFLLSAGLGLQSLALGLSNLAYLNPVMLPALFDLLGLDEWLDDLYLKLPDWARGLWEGFWQVIEDMVVAVFNFDQTFALVEDIVATFKEAFDADGDKWYEIGGNIIKGILEGLLVPVSFILEPIVDFFDSLIKNICDVFGIASPAKEMKPYGENILLGILEGFKDAFTSWWDSIKTWGSTTKDKFKTWASGIWDGIKGVFTSVGTWFKTTFEGAWTNIKTAFSGVKTWFETKYNDITGIFKNIPDWFKTKFTDAWTNVKNVFSTGGKIFDGIKDGIAETFKTVVNGLINGINRIIKTPFEKINSMLNTIRDVSVLGIEPFKNLWSRNPLSIPQIPALAQGGYVGANQPQLAMIGDNKREGEIVSPESKFQEMLNAAAKLSGGGGITEEILYRVMSRVFRENQLILVPDGNGLYKIIKKANRENYLQTGRNDLVY
ncbi:MAG: hypothetical protein K0R34_2163 [Herbinix sp.]|jgi:phage-related protein|nr:hypothetical protein [Herbinix sp.]